jgi:hypothetical protein
MQADAPKTVCCGVPVVWSRYSYWEDEVWEGLCVWCHREFAYFNPRDVN